MFLLGYKSMISLNKKRHKEWELLKSLDYPFDEEKSSIIFYLNEEIKSNIQKKLSLHEPLSVEWHKILGAAYGYPQKSVEYYSEGIPDEGEKNRIFVNYHGLIFITHRELLLETIVELVEKYPLSVEHQLGITIEYYSETERDFRLISQVFPGGKINLDNIRNF
jgi:hypothetical protein